MPDPFTPASAELRAVGTSVDQMRDTLERMERADLHRAADLGNTVSRLTTLLSSFESGLKDIRLTMTGIGSLAKSLSERSSQHDDLLALLVLVSEKLTALYQKDHPHA